jgi:hypothetical protein
MAKATCHGGPLDGREWAYRERFPKGFVLADPERRLAVVYDRTPNGFSAQSVEPLREDGLLWAAQGATYDVVAYDAERMGPWER